MTVNGQLRGGGGGYLVSYDLSYRYDFAVVNSVVVAFVRPLLDALASNEGRTGTWKAGIAGVSCRGFVWLRGYSLTAGNGNSYISRVTMILLGREATGSGFGCGSYKAHRLFVKTYTYSFCVCNEVISMNTIRCSIIVDQPVI